jgi:biotin carboxylase
MDRRPVVLLLSSGYHLYREYLLEQLAGACDVWLLLSQEPTWERTYIIGSTLVDTLDSDAVVDAAREVTRKLPVEGVLCWDEIRLPISATLTTALNLPGCGVEAMWRCRDKYLTRQALAAAGIAQPWSVKVATLAAAVEAAELVGYPAVLKPRAMASSSGVVLVRSPAELADGWTLARGVTKPGVAYQDDGVLVEEYLDGPEVSVDAACFDGRVEPLCLARKQLGYPPYFEETGHLVVGDDPLLGDAAVRDLLAGAHTAIGFTQGLTHTELRLTADGPKVVEINGRLGGDLIPYVGWLATGIDPGAVAAAVACGRQPPTAPIRTKAAAVRFLYPERDATARRVVVDHGRLPAQVDRVVPLVVPGRRLRLPPNDNVACRYAYVTAVGSDAGECLRALDMAASAIRLETETGEAQPVGQHSFENAAVSSGLKRPDNREDERWQR